jgi:hypothetical protein
MFALKMSRTMKFLEVEGFVSFEKPVERAIKAEQTID